MTCFSLRLAIKKLNPESLPKLMRSITKTWFQIKPPLLKFIYSERLQKFKEISEFLLTIPSNVNKSLDISSNFCGLLRVNELYRHPASCKFFSSWLINHEVPQIKSQTMRHPLMNLINTTLSQKYGVPELKVSIYGSVLQSSLN